MKKVFSLLVLFGALLLFGCVGSSTQEPAATVSSSTVATSTPEPASGENTVEITASGFTPATLTVNTGDAVTFMNKGSSPARPASAVHPTHTIYPEPGGCVGSKFDSCDNIAPGGSWSFTFTHVGEWKYHNHLNPAQVGTIIVK